MKTSSKSEKSDAVDGQKGDRADWHLGDPADFKVNPTFQRLIPWQSKGELLALEASIEAEGCRDPLLVWKGHDTVLDGHTRREFCIKHKKQVKIREIDLTDEKAAIEFILQIQRQRRNLTREAMSYFRGAEYNATKQQRGGYRHGRKSKGLLVPLTGSADQSRAEVEGSETTNPQDAAKLLAAKYGVSDKTVKRDAIFAQVVDRIVADYGEPEIQRKLLSADVKLTQGLARVLLKKSAAERKAAVDRLLAEGEMPRAKKDKASKARPKEMAQSIFNRLKTKGEDQAKAVLKQLAKLMGFELSEKGEEK